MARLYTSPILLNEVKTISITQLKKWGYLQADSKPKSGNITWSRNGIETSSIGITVDMQQNCIELTYTVNGEPRRCVIALVNAPANIGNGLLWLFECPETGKRCRKLYYANTYFLHREAHRGAMYESQTYSSNTRAKIKILEQFHTSWKAQETINQPHFKSWYAGQPTKRYKRAMNHLKAAAGYSPEDYDRLFIL